MVLLPIEKEPLGISTMYICGTLDKDRNDQGTTAKLVDAGFLVSDKFRDKNIFDFLF